MQIHEERRLEPRSELHRIWNVSVESEIVGHRMAQVLDYSPSGMRLAVDGVAALKAGERLEIHYPGTNFSYVTTVAWCRQKHHKTLIGARLVATCTPLGETC